MYQRENKRLSGHRWQYPTLSAIRSGPLVKSSLVTDVEELGEVESLDWRLLNVSCAKGRNLPELPAQRDAVADACMLNLKLPK